jgi:hypothetical protein
VNTFIKLKPDELNAFVTKNGNQFLNLLTEKADSAHWQKLLSKHSSKGLPAFLKLNKNQILNSFVEHKDPEMWSWLLGKLELADLKAMLRDHTLNPNYFVERILGLLPSETVKKIFMTQSMAS